MSWLTSLRESISSGNLITHAQMQHDVKSKTKIASDINSATVTIQYCESHYLLLIMLPSSPHHAQTSKKLKLSLYQVKFQIRLCCFCLKQNCVLDGKNPNVPGGGLRFICFSTSFCSSFSFSASSSISLTRALIASSSCNTDRKFHESCLSIVGLIKHTGTLI